MSAPPLSRATIVQLRCLARSISPAKSRVERESLSSLDAIKTSARPASSSARAFLIPGRFRLLPEKPASSMMSSNRYPRALHASLIASR